jgi:hypothetical protein
MAVRCESPVERAGTRAFYVDGRRQLFIRYRGTPGRGGGARRAQRSEITFANKPVRLTFARAAGILLAKAELA